MIFYEIETKFHNLEQIPSDDRLILLLMLKKGQRKITYVPILPVIRHEIDFYFC